MDLHLREVYDQFYNGLMMYDFSVSIIDKLLHFKPYFKVIKLNRNNDLARALLIW